MLDEFLSAPGRLADFFETALALSVAGWLHPGPSDRIKAQTRSQGVAMNKIPIPD